MNSSLYAGVQIAEGYRFTDQLNSDYLLASGHRKSACTAVILSDVNSNKVLELLGEDVAQRNRLVCFSPDGSTLYYHTDNLYAKDLATGATHRLTGISQEPPFEELRSLECSPDNRTLVFMQTTASHFVRGRSQGSPYRLCRISTDGNGFQVLYEDPPDCRLLTVDCCWQHGFALLTRTKERSELLRVDLANGDCELIDRFSDLSWNVSIHPDGRQVAWSSFAEEIYLGSLEGGATERLVSGTYPAWSPNGEMLAYMEDEHRLCIWDRASNRSQSLVWFAPPNLSYRERRSSYATEPVWSPDGQVLWFALTQTRKLPPPRNLSERLQEIRRYITPVLHNLNPNRKSYCRGYKPHACRFRHGILDLAAKQIRLSKGYAYEVSWLPQTASPSIIERNINDSASHL